MSFDLFGDVQNFQVANKLYPISSLTQNIEDYAKEMLISVTSTDKTNAVGLNLESQKVRCLIFR